MHNDLSHGGPDGYGALEVPALDLVPELAAAAAHGAGAGAEGLRGGVGAVLDAGNREQAVEVLGKWGPGAEADGL